MVTVKRLLESKTKGFWTVAPDVTAYDALQIMVDRDISALLIVSERNLLGILTERDYARKVVYLGRSSKDTLVSDIMTKSVHCVTPEDTIESCMEIMDDKHIRHLPVLEDGKLTGILSIRDVVKILAAKTG